MSVSPPEDPDRAIDWHATRRLIHRRLVELSQPDDRPDLDDLVQESCVRLLRAVTATEHENVGGLATVVARRTWVDYLRRKTRARRMFVVTGATDVERSAGAPHTSTGSLDAPHLGDLRDRIALVVQEILASRGAEGCLELARAYFDARDWTSVAKEIDVAYATVRKRWSRCVAMVRETMAEDPDFAELFARTDVTPAISRET